jgi:hypothetical protein
MHKQPSTMTTASKAWVCEPSLAAVASSNPAGVMDVCLSLVSVVCCQVEVSESLSMIMKPLQ